MTVVIVAGQGSIGQRHARLLDGAGHSVIVATSRPDEARFPAAATLEGALALASQDGRSAVEYVVIATPTASHAQDLATALSATERQNPSILLEKPLALALSEINWLARLDERRRERVSIGYNWRWRAGLADLRRRLEATRIWRARLVCHSHLPSWRPQRDYRETSSARAALGGGVLRDLSHELDFAHFLFGGWRRTTAWGGRLSTLDIDVEDGVEILAETERSPLVSLSLTYFDRPARRRIEVSTNAGFFAFDLLTGALSHDGSVIEDFGPPDVDEMMLAQHYAALSGRSDPRLCSLEDALSTQAWIAAAEQSLARPRWVERDEILEPCSAE